MLKGRLRATTNDGERIYEVNQAFDWGPATHRWRSRAAKYVDVSPTEELQTVTTHIQGGGYRAHTGDCFRARAAMEFGAKEKPASHDGCLLDRGDWI